MAANSNQPRDPFSAFLCDAATVEVAREVAGGFGWPIERVQTGGLRSAAQMLAASASPKLLLVDLTDCADPMEEIEGLAEVVEPGTMVIACGTLNDIHFYRNLLASGIHEYLHKPLTADHLRDAIASAEETAAGATAQAPSSAEPHVMTAVIGVRGGVGCSTVAVSTAWLLSERKRATALLDLDVHFGTGALALDLEPGRGLTDAIENPGRIDGLFIERALVRHNDKLGVLSAEAPISQALSGDGGAFFQLQDELRNAFSCTVLDLPRHMLVQHPTLLHDVATAIVVTELTLAATRDTIRILSWLKSHAPTTKVVVIANKVPAAGQEEVARKEFEKSIERRLDFVIPLEPKFAVQAAKLGKPLAEVAKGTKLGQAMPRLAATILGEKGSVGKAGASLLGRIGDVRAMLPRKMKKAA